MSTPFRTWLAGLTSKSAPVDADELYVNDTVAGASKRLTWSNLKATLKTYFDTVYAASSHNQAASTISDSTTTGRAVVTATDAAAARTAIGAGTSSFDGAYSSLSGKPTLGDAAAKNTGTTTGTVAAGDDARLSDPRAPTAHTHSLSAISQSGATTGQVAAWNGSAWAPATASGGGVSQPDLNISRSISFGGL